MRKVLCFTLFATLLFNACTSEEAPEEKLNNGIEILLSVDHYLVTSSNTKAALRATDVGSATEQNITNLYIFLFNSAGTNPIRYSVTGALFAGGSWSSADKKVTLDLTQAETGERQVYIVANYPLSMATQLNSVSTIADLEAMLQTFDTPWSPSIGAPLLMSGQATHNFLTNGRLNSVPLTRAVAKLELTLTLKAENKSLPVINSVSQYQYRFVNFNKNTCLLKRNPIPDNPVNSPSWMNWEATMTNEVGTSYILNSGVVESLTLITYLNERENPGTAVELKLPLIESGFLPPPEFGDETYTLVLPAVIERNHWYKYVIN